MNDTNHDVSRFFEKEAPEDYLQAWSKQIAQEKESLHREDRGALLLKLGNEYLAWSGLSCLSVLPAQPIHAIPHRSHPVLKGISAIGGKLVPCFSLARLLEMEEALPVHEQSLILMGKEGQTSGMLVEHIETYIRFHQDSIKALPSNLSQTGQCFSRGLLEWQGQCVPLLDENLVMSGFERCMQ